jgi:hypothetical protein
MVFQFFSLMPPSPIDQLKIIIEQSIGEVPLWQGTAA